MLDLVPGAFANRRLPCDPRVSVRPAAAPGAVPFTGFEGVSDNAGMDLTSNPLFGDAAFTPASAARGEYLNSTYESPGAAAFGSAFGSPARPWSDIAADPRGDEAGGYGGNGGFDPDPRLYDMQEEAQRILQLHSGEGDPAVAPPTAAMDASLAGMARSTDRC